LQLLRPVRRVAEFGSFDINPPLMNATTRITCGGLLLLGVALSGCNQRGAGHYTEEELVRYQEAYEAQQAKIAAQDARADAQLDRYDTQLASMEKQEKRYDALLKRWEEQADRQDAILDRQEKVLDKIESLR